MVLEEKWLWKKTRTNVQNDQFVFQIRLWRDEIPDPMESLVFTEVRCCSLQIHTGENSTLLFCSNTYFMIHIGPSVDIELRVLNRIKCWERILRHNLKQREAINSEHLPSRFFSGERIYFWARAPLHVCPSQTVADRISLICLHHSSNEYSKLLI